MAPNSKNLVWLDLEMTGLNPNSDRILEIATIITNDNLDILAEGPVFVIHQSNEILENMDEWNTKYHGASGLIERSKKSKITEKIAQAETIEFLMKHVPCDKSPLCGSSIHHDRKFLSNWMPQLDKYFHYRNLDVSTIKILAKKWNPDLTKGFQKVSKHVALSDIKDSIEELRYYKENFFKNKLIKQFIFL